MKEKKVTWNKSNRETSKRETDFDQIIEGAATEERKEERDRDKLGDRLEALLERKKEEDAATCLMEEKRKNWKVAQNESFEEEQNLCNALREYADTFDKDHGRPKTAMTKLWQRMQSRDTKNLNF